MKKFTFNKKHMKLSLVTVLVLCFFSAAFMTAILTVKPKQAEAICCTDCCYCVVSATMKDQSEWVSSYIKLNMHFYFELMVHQKTWFEWQYWLGNLLPMMVQASNQLAAVGTMQVSIVGMFFDAKEQLETQRDLQIMKARAHKDYHPSYEMCEFGTRVKSLAASERIGEINGLSLSERSTDRYFGNRSTAYAKGEAAETLYRLSEFADKFCNPFDNDHSLSSVCNLSYSSATSPTEEQRERMNKDVDYQRTLADPWTLNLDFTVDHHAPAYSPSDQEEEILALGENLYGYETFPRVDPDALQNGTGNSLTSLQEAYLKMRSVVAKMKVAENSYNALVGQKAEGAEGSAEFLQAYLKELGMPADEIDDLIGDKPSYFAQMEILTKKAYQSQMFYTNLYDKPANVKRKGVAIQAIGLMQKFDLLKSYLRTEASLSILLELSVDEMQKQVDTNIDNFGLSN